MRGRNAVPVRTVVLPFDTSVRAPLLLRALHDVTRAVNLLIPDWRLPPEESRFRRQEDHSISKRLVSAAKDTRRGIALQDLSGISQRTTVRRGQRRRQRSWGFAQLRSHIEYKAEAAGVPVALVDPRNTTRTCPRCGAVDKKNRPTQGDFRWAGCGLAGLADHNAAVNLAARARVDRPTVAGEEMWCRSHVDLSYKLPVSTGGR